MTPEIRHDADGARYELVVGDRVVGVADYRDRGDALVLHHTEIQPTRRGHGLNADGRASR